MPEELLRQSWRLQRPWMLYDTDRLSSTIKPDTQTHKEVKMRKMETKLRADVSVKFRLVRNYTQHDGGERNTTYTGGRHTSGASSSCARGYGQFN